MEDIEKLIKTVEKLRAPNGCPWDREQTHKTLKRYLIEETYEAIDAIDSENSTAIMEELGDVLLQVVLHAQIASEDKRFNINDIAKVINEKMISRHPHVFGDVTVKNTEEVLVNWEALKKKEKPERKDIFDGIPVALPALLKAYKISKKASKDGFDWENEKDIWNAFEKELKEVKDEIKSGNKEKLSEEFGDLLFMMANIARWYKIEPEEALSNGSNKFMRRYKMLSESVKESNKEIKNLTPSELNKIWDEVKLKEKQ
jgi:tetrapyrrole methylase family protein/MazG family protein